MALPCRVRLLQSPCGHADDVTPCTPCMARKRFHRTRPQRPATAAESAMYDNNKITAHAVPQPCHEGAANCMQLRCATCLGGHASTILNRPP